jgi:hypothetical protein
MRFLVPFGRVVLHSHGTRLKANEEASSACTLTRKTLDPQCHILACVVWSCIPARVSATSSLHQAESVQAHTTNTGASSELTQIGPNHGDRGVNREQSARGDICVGTEATASSKPARRRERGRG